MNRSKPQWPAAGLALIRIITGLLMFYHGWELFDAEKMKPYFTWPSVQSLPSPKLMVHAGKAAELISGLFLTFGLFTRAAALLMAAIMLFISFRIGQGRFFYEDQHPFLFALLALVFFFNGGGAWSVDNTSFKQKHVSAS